MTFTSKILPHKVRHRPDGLEDRGHNDKSPDPVRHRPDGLEDLRQH